MTLRQNYPHKKPFVVNNSLVFMETSVPDVTEHPVGEQTRVNAQMNRRIRNTHEKNIKMMSLVIGITLAIASAVLGFWRRRGCIRVFYGRAEKN